MRDGQPFRYFNSSPVVIRLTVMLYIRYPLSLRQDPEWEVGGSIRLGQDSQTTAVNL